MSKKNQTKNEQAVKEINSILQENELMLVPVLSVVSGNISHRVEVVNKPKEEENKIVKK